MSKPPPKKPLGRPITDEKGNRTWNWGSDAKVDTATVRALGEGLSFQPSTGAPEGSNPYDRTAANAPDGDQGRRRTLDDMRRLSEKIKRSKHWPHDK